MWLPVIRYCLFGSLFLFPRWVLAQPNTMAEQTDTVIKRYSDMIDTTSIWKYLRALAHDSMMGRRPGTPGQIKTVQYLIRAFREAGLTPAYHENYLQTVPLLHAAVNGTLAVRNKMQVLHIADSSMLIKGIEAGDKNFADAALVFVGYGITAPELGWDDYKNADVKGKMVVVLDKEPKRLIKRGFGSSTSLTYHAQFFVKDEIAKSHGAKGMILLSDVKKYTAQAKWWQQNDVTLLAGGLTAFQSNVIIRLSQYAAEQFAIACDASVDRWKELASDSNFVPFVIPATADINLHIQAVPFNSYNVIGYIKGSDPVLNKECIVYSTHWDGFGIGIPQKSDSIYNAAKDNAGGIAEVISIAKAIRAMPHAPRRSIVFIASTAEESGKLGAEAYVRNPLFPLNKTVLAIGMDIFAPWGRSLALTNAAFGYTNTDVLLTQLANKRGLPYTAPQTISQLANSDQYMFARRGVPVVFGGVENSSFTLPDKAVDSIEALSPAHSPFDEIFPAWNLQSAVDEAKIYFELGIIVANAGDPPQWKVQSKFNTPNRMYP